MGQLLLRKVWFLTLLKNNVSYTEAVGKQLLSTRCYSTTYGISATMFGNIIIAQLGPIFHVTKMYDLTDLIIYIYHFEIYPVFQR